MRYNCPKRIPTHHLEKFILIRRDMKQINFCDCVDIIFCHDDNPNVELYVVERYTKIATKGLDNVFFSKRKIWLLQILMREYRIKHTQIQSCCISSISRFTPIYVVKYRMSKKLDMAKMSMYRQRVIMSL